MKELKDLKRMVNEIDLLVSNKIEARAHANMMGFRIEGALEKGCDAARLEAYIAAQSELRAKWGVEVAN